MLSNYLKRITWIIAGLLFAASTWYVIRYFQWREITCVFMIFKPGCFFLSLPREEWVDSLTMVMGYGEPVKVLINGRLWISEVFIYGAAREALVLNAAELKQRLCPVAV